MKNSSSVNFQTLTFTSRRLMAVDFEDDCELECKGMVRENEHVQLKIKTLLEDVTILQHQMTQAINALNTCASTFEFSGSTEAVVAEWKLLIARECFDL